MIADNSILKQLHDKGFIVSKIKGVSMWPLLNQKNTQIYVAKADQYVKNDCILFLRKNGELIIHRILSVKKDYYRVCGDNQAIVEKVYKEQVHGKLIEYYKHGKTKQLKGIKYYVYVLFMRILRPVRYLRDVCKHVIKKIFRLNKTSK